MRRIHILVSRDSCYSIDTRGKILEAFRGPSLRYTIDTLSAVAGTHVIANCIQKSTRATITSSGCLGDGTSRVCARAVLSQFCIRIPPILFIIATKMITTKLESWRTAAIYLSKAGASTSWRTDSRCSLCLQAKSAQHFFCGVCDRTGSSALHGNTKHPRDH